MGRVFKPKYAWTNAKGERIEKITEAWYIEYSDAGGRWVRRKAGVTKEQAKDALRKAESDVLAIKNGLPTERVSDLLIKDLMTAYITARRQRTRQDYAEQAEADFTRVFEFCGIHYLRQLTPAAVEKYIAHLLDDGKSSATANRVLTRLKAMLNWAVRTRRIPYNPIACIERAQGAKRRVRRALTDDEIGRLMTAALDGPRRRGMRRYQNRPRKDGTYKPADVPLYVQAKWANEGRNNVIAYRIMLETGLRKNECRLLTWADVDLAAGTLTTRPHWEGNKNGKQETLPLAPGLLDALRSWNESRSGLASAPVVRITDRLLRCFDNDLLAAGIDKKDAAGHVLDLHALRHTFGTRLGRMPGIDPKSVQTLMRHSDPRLTFGVYVHADRDRLAAAVASLPSINVVEPPITPCAPAAKIG